MKANELEEYSAKELDRLSREREEAIKAKGGLPYLGSLPVGESKLILQARIPTDNPDRDGRPRKTRLSDRKLGVATRSQYKKRRQDFTSSPVGGRGSGQPLTERIQSALGPQTVCRQEGSGWRRFRLDREHQIAPLPRPARLPAKVAHNAPRHTDRRRTNRHALHGQGRVTTR